ncbi:MAG TPA: hypothetical protein PKN53_08160 [Bacteroidales bacterium]|jgi:hypothetical protein|nr:hypothetical protein [Bacteroidales bacterium]
MTTEKAKSLQAILDKKVDGKKIFGTSFALKKDNTVWQGASGNLSRDIQKLLIKRQQIDC